MMSASGDNPLNEGAGATPENALSSEPGARQARRPAHASEPDSISKAFYIEEKRGERRYFEDYKRTSLAMRATETSVMSKRQDLNTIRAMLEIAAARGWHSVAIKGSGEFRREAWIEATARGLEGHGFTPSDLDRQEADRRRAERPRARRPGEPPAPTLNDNRRSIREAEGALSRDGRVMLAALSEKIDRQMDRHNAEARADMKAFVATELVRKERAEGPIALSADQRRIATANQPVQAEPRPAEPAPARRVEPEAPRRTLGR